METFSWITSSIVLPLLIAAGWENITRPDAEPECWHSGATPDCPTWEEDADLQAFVFEYRNTLPPTFND